MVKKKRKILIVGGTGFIGFHLAAFLKKKKFEIIIVSEHKPKKKRFLKNVKYIQFNISKFKNFKKIKNFNFDHVVNLGGNVDHSNKRKTFKSHFNGAKNLSKFFLRKKILSFIQMGSGGEYGNLKSPHKETEICRPNKSSVYSYAKYKTTNFLISLFKKYNFPITVLRLYQAYGPHQDTNRFIPILITNCIKNKKFKTSHGKQYRDFIFIDDLIKIIFKCLDNNKVRGKIINVGFGKPINIKKIILKVVKICKGGKPDFGKISLRKDENLITYPNISKLKKNLSFSPKISFEKGIKRTIKSYRN